MNSITVKLASTRLSSARLISGKLKSVSYKGAELGPAFRTIYRSNKQAGVKLAEAYALTLDNHMHNREFFQSVATMKKEERFAVIDGYKSAGQGRGIVSAISQLPRAQGHLLMKDFIFHGKEKKDSKAVEDVLEWLRAAGQAILDASKKTKRPPDDLHDEAIIDIITDITDAIEEAVTSVVDALVNATKTLGQALSEIVNWTLDATAALCRALLDGTRTIADLLQAAVETGYQLVRKVLDGLEHIGQAMFTILADAFKLIKESLVIVLKAIDNLGRVLVDLLKWLATQTFDIVKKGVEALLEIGKSIGNILEQSLSFGLTLLTNTVKAMLEIGKTIGEILITAVTRPGALLDKIVLSFKNLGKTLVQLFDEVKNAAGNVLNAVVKAAARIGTSIVEFAAYVATAVVDTARKVVSALLEVGKTIKDLVLGMAQHALSAVKRLVEILFSLGKSLLEVFKEIAFISFNILKKAIQSAFELGKTIAEFTKEMVHFTYKTAARLIDAALEVGATIAKMLESVAKAGYYIIRKVINGIIQATGPVGAVFQWLIDKGEALTSGLWREVIQAIKFVKKSVTDIMDWAVTQANELFDVVITLLQDTGSLITEILDWAKNAGAQAMEWLGEAFNRVGNSIEYALSYLENDLIDGLDAFIRGAFKAGFAIVDFVAWAAKKPFEVAAAVIKELIALGATVGQLLVDSLVHPDQALSNFVKAIREAGSAVKDIVKETWKITVKDAKERIIAVLIALKESAEEMLDAALEISLGAVFTLVGILMEILGNFRTLTPQETAEAKKVFGNSLPYPEINIHIGSWLADISSFFQKHPNAITTMRVIHFPSDTVLKPGTDDTTPAGNFDWLIHELTHVWQGEHIGPFYMAHALYSQSTEDDAYKYEDAGKTEEQTLIDAHANHKSIKDYNPEAMGEIVADFYRRTLISEDTAAWKPFIDEVQAA